MATVEAIGVVSLNENQLTISPDTTRMTREGFFYVLVAAFQATHGTEPLPDALQGGSVQIPLTPANIAALTACPLKWHPDAAQAALRAVAPLLRRQLAAESGGGGSWDTRGG